jgi:hypothetical protein
VEEMVVKEEAGDAVEKKVDDDEGEGDGDGNVEGEGVNEGGHKTVAKDEDGSDMPVEENTKEVESGGEAKEKTNGTNGLAGGVTEETVLTIKDETTNDTEENGAKVAMGTNSSTDLTSETGDADAVVKAGGDGNGDDDDKESVKGEESKSSEDDTENGKSEAIARPRRVVVHDAVEVRFACICSFSPFLSLCVCFSQIFTSCYCARSMTMKLISRRYNRLTHRYNHILRLPTR